MCASRYHKRIADIGKSTLWDCWLQNCFQKEAVLLPENNQIVYLSVSNWWSGCKDNGNGVYECNASRAFASSRERWWYLAVSHCSFSQVFGAADRIGFQLGCVCCCAIALSLLSTRCYRLACFAGCFVICLYMLLLTHYQMTMLCSLCCQFSALYAIKFFAGVWASL